MFPQEFTDKLTAKLIEGFNILFQANPVFAIGLLLFLLWHLLLKPLVASGGSPSDIPSKNKVNQNPMIIGFFAEHPLFPGESLVGFIASSIRLTVVMTTQRLWMYDKKRCEYVNLTLSEIAQIIVCRGWFTCAATVRFKGGTEQTYENLENAPSSASIARAIERSNSLEAFTPAERVRDAETNIQDPIVRPSGSDAVFTSPDDCRKIPEAPSSGAIPEPSAVYSNLEDATSAPPQPDEVKEAKLERRVGFLVACFLVAVVVGSVLVFHRGGAPRSRDSVPPSTVSSGSSESPQDAELSHGSCLPVTRNSETSSKYSSEPFGGYPETMEDSVVDAFRYKAGFDVLTDNEAAYKVLLIDAHYLYFCFVKCYPNSAHVSEMKKQMSRFRCFRTDDEDTPATDGSIKFTLQETISFGDLVSEFHWNKHFTRNMWATVPFVIAGGVPVRAPITMGNLQWQGTACIQDKHLKVYKGTMIIFPSAEMSTEAKAYRDAVGVKAGYLPDPSVSEKPEDLVKLALTYMNRTSERDKVEEIKLWSRAAALGSAPAQTQVGVAIVNGEWLTCDPAEAGKMLLCATKAGDEGAKRVLRKVQAEQKDNDVLAEIQRVVDEDGLSATGETRK